MKTVLQECDYTVHFVDELVVTSNVDNNDVNLEEVLIKLYRRIQIKKKETIFVKK